MGLTLTLLTTAVTATETTVASPPDRHGYVFAAYGAVLVLLALYSAVLHWRLRRLEQPDSDEESA